MRVGECMVTVGWSSLRDNCLLGRRVYGKAEGRDEVLFGELSLDLRRARFGEAIVMCQRICGSSGECRW
jgi:hypothetical protein